ncbi:chemotaxis protein, partial [Vibrio diabolicus]|nr:chemotaxis protein [Vibrio diabolicus]
MKFRHKVVTASSFLLLITVSLLSTQQVMTIRSQTQEHIDSSVNEILTSVGNTVQSEMNAKKDLARSITEVIQLNPSSHNYVQNILERPTPKASFLAIGFGYESNGFVIENDDGWEAGPDYDPRQRPWFIAAKNKGDLVVTD